MCRNNLVIRLHTSEIKSCCIFKRKTQFQICYGMDIFPGHVTFDDLFKQSDWLLRLPLVCFDYFGVSLLLSHKKILTFFQVLFIFSHIQNLTNFDIDSYLLIFFSSKHRLWVLVRAALTRRFKCVPTINVLSKYMKNIIIFLMQFSFFKTKINVVYSMGKFS